MRPAAVIAWFTGLGFGLPGAYGLWFLVDHDRVWMFLGFPTYGDGPFEDVGLDASPGLLTAFVVVCGLEVLAGCRLWARQRRGVLLAFWLLPLELVFWIGFALPFGFVLGALRTGVLLADGDARTALRSRRARPRAPRLTRRASGR